MSINSFKKNQKLLRSSLFAAVAMTFSAQAEVTAPVGYVELMISAEADTPFTIPMNRPKEYAGLYSAQSGNTVTIANNDLTAGAFDEGLQHKRYYILFTTGTLSGRSFDIVSNTVNTITVAQEGLENLEEIIANPSALNNFEIRPHWTLGTLFPNGENIPKTTDFGVRQGLVQFRPIIDSTNVPINVEYLYFDNADDSFDGWYLPNNPSAGIQDDVVLRTQTSYLFRNNTLVEYKPKIVGDVPTTDFSNSLRTNVVRIDNYKAISFPVELSLSESNLFESGVFQATTDFGLRNGDILQAYTYPITGFNPSITTEYLYFDSSDNSFDGWYLPNNPSAGKQDAEKVFKPGRAYIIRTFERTQEDKPFWLTPIPYDPFAENTP